MMKQIVQAVSNLGGLQHALILDIKGDTFFSDSLIVDEGKEAMGIFLHFISFANRLRIAGNIQLKNGGWELDDIFISLLTINENILIISHEQEYDTLKLSQIIKQIFDDIN